MPRTPTKNKRLRSWQDILTSTEIPRLDAELLAAFVLNKDRIHLLTHPQISFTPQQAARFSRLASRRRLGQPLAYLLGEREFYDLSFKVSKAVLVPRPETEMLVDRALDIIKKTQGRLDLLDIGTGSGAIALGTATWLRRHFPVYYRRLKVAAIDISAGALRVARTNSRRHRLENKVKFLQGNLLEPIGKKNHFLTADHLLICANLPYLTPAQIRASASIQAEPKIALDGGPDGLKYYRRLFTQLKSLRLTKTVTLLCEIDPCQKSGALKLARQSFPEAMIEISSDLAKRPRLLGISISKK